MVRMTLSAVLAEDRSRAALSLSGEDVPGAHVELGATEVSETVERLAAIRAGMLPEVDRELKPGQRLPAVADPIWRAVVDSGRIMLAVRHPGFGWLAFELPPGSAGGLGRFLTQSSETSI